MADFTVPGSVYKALLPSPFQILQFGERNRQMQEERDMQRAQKVMEENSKSLDKAFAYKANPVISQYQPYFDSAIKDFQTQASKLMRSGDPNAKLWIANKQTELDGKANILTDVQSKMKDVWDLAKNNERYNADWVNNNLASSIYDQNGRIKDPSDLDASDPGKILQDYRAYNPAILNKEFADSVEENVVSSLQSSTRGGVKFLDRYKQASKFAKLDSDGKAVYDTKTGRLQLNITPELVNKYLQDDGRKLWAEQKVKEHQDSGDKNYSFNNAVADLLEGTGYAKPKELVENQVLDRSGLQMNFFGGSAEKDTEYKAAAKYFYDLVNGPEQTKKTLLGDISNGKDFAADYQKAPEKAAPSNKGYVVIDYNPLSRFGDYMDQLLGSQLQTSLGLDAGEAKDYLAKARKDHKILVNLDNEEQAWRELNYWRNLSRNQDLNSDILKGAYDEHAYKNKKGKFNNLGKKAADDL